MAKNYINIDWAKIIDEAANAWQYYEPAGTAAPINWNTYQNIKQCQRLKIKINPEQSINTSVFEEATVLEYNGALTKEGMKEYAGEWVNEGQIKPFIDFLNI